MYIGPLCTSPAIKTQKGFTLLEVVIALMVFALIGTSIQKVTSQTITQYERIRLKTIASWIAENKMAEVRLSDSLPQARESRQDLEYGNDNWQVVSKVIKTENPYVNRVDLEIYHKQSDDQFEKGNQVLIMTAFAGLN